MKHRLIMMTAVLVMFGMGTCLAFGDTMQKQEVVSENENTCDHQWSDDYTYDSPKPCTEPIYRWRTCIICHADGEKEIVRPAKSHTWEQWEQWGYFAPDCINPGMRYYYCSGCGESKNVEIPPTGHKWKKADYYAVYYDEDLTEITAKYGCECSECNTFETVPIKLKKGKKHNFFKYSKKRIKKYRVKFRSYKKKIATVNKRGKVKARKRGTTWIVSEFKYKGVLMTYKYKLIVY